MMKYLLMIIAVISFPALSYEVQTHSLLSSYAASNSILGADEKFLKSIGHKGLLDSKSNEYGEDLTYWNGGFVNREHAIYEYGSVLELIQHGAIAEDLDPSTRAANHFFDPQNNVPLAIRALDYAGVVNYTSPDWALETHYDLVFGDPSSYTYYQKYSYKDAYGYYERYFTSVDDASRKNNFGLLFRSIGQVIHHIQDMAQPQHARVDDHCHADFNVLVQWLEPVLQTFMCYGGHEPSLYERYSNSVRNEFSDKGYTSENSYPIPEMNHSRDFFETKEGQGIQGKGIAEYTSFNFISEGSNYFVNLDGSFGTYKNLPYPEAPIKSDYKEEIYKVNENKSVLLKYYGNKTHDKLNPSIEYQQYNNYATALGMAYRFYFIQNTVAFDNLPTFTVNKKTMDEAHKYLIPRAVSYSAGIINHFFRVRFEAEPVIYQENNKVHITLKNVSKTNEFSYDLVAGSYLKLFYTDKDGINYPISQIETSDLSAGDDNQFSLIADWHYDGEVTLTLTLPDNWDRSKEISVLWKGDTKREETGMLESAVGGYVIDVEPASFYAWSSKGSSYLYLSEQDQRAQKTVDQLEIGNINWRGNYIDGYPVWSLSWFGSNGRYFNSKSITSENIFRTNNVYMNGIKLAEAPQLVTGAAIQKRFDGNWLIVVGINDVVYRAKVDTYKTELLSEFEEVGPFYVPYSEYVTDEDYLNRPDWFFNGDGDNAVSIRKIDNWPANRQDFNIDHHIEYGTPRQLLKLSVENTAKVETDPIGVLTLSGGETTGTFVFAADYLDDQLLLGSVDVSRQTTYHGSPPLGSSYSWSSSQLWTMNLPFSNPIVHYKKQQTGTAFSRDNSDGSKTYGTSKNVSELIQRAPMFMDMRYGAYAFLVGTETSGLMDLSIEMQDKMKTTVHSFNDQTRQNFYDRLQYHAATSSFSIATTIYYLDDDPMNAFHHVSGATDTRGNFIFVGNRFYRNYYRNWARFMSWVEDLEAFADANDGLVGVGGKAVR